MKAKFCALWLQTYCNVWAGEALAVPSTNMPAHTDDFYYQAFHASAHSATCVCTAYPTITTDMCKLINCSLAQGSPKKPRKTVLLFPLLASCWFCLFVGFVCLFVFHKTPRGAIHLRPVQGLANKQERGVFVWIPLASILYMLQQCDALTPWIALSHYEC